MVNSTIGGTFVLEGDGQSFIGDNSAKKEAILTPMPLYLLDADETEVFDFGGVIKTISLTGVFIAVSIENAETFITNIESLIQGHQDNAAGYPKEFVDDYRGTINVFIQSCETTKEAGEPLIVRWSIKLIQGTI